jgi:hypothetical protein
MIVGKLLRTKQTDPEGHPVYIIQNKIMTSVYDSAEALKLNAVKKKLEANNRQ